MTIEEIRLLNASDVGRALGVSSKTVLRWHKEGIGPVATIIGEHVYFKEVDVLAWIAEKREKQS